MDGSRGKRYEWQMAEQAGDALALTIQDYLTGPTRCCMRELGGDGSS